MRIQHIQWTPEMHARLAELWAIESMTATEIGRAMGCTKNAIIGQVHREHLPKRDSPVIRKLPTVPITLHNIAPNGCRWPFGDPKADGFHLCGDQSMPGRPYCSVHYKQAYIKINADKFIPGPTAIFFGGSSDRQ